MSGRKSSNVTQVNPAVGDIPRRTIWIGGPVSWLRGNLPAAVVCFTGLCLTLIASQATRDLYRSAAEQEFERQASHYVLALKKATARHLELVGAAAELLGNSSPATGRLDLFEFARSQLPYYPGFEALAWVPAVSGTERKAYIRRAEADGLRGFGFTEFTGTGAVVNAARRPLHLPIYIVEPYKGNERLLGFDLASVPMLRSALTRAGRASRMDAVDWNDPRRGVHRRHKTLLLIQPAYKANAGTDAVNDGIPIGYVVALFRIDLLLGVTLREFTTPAWLDTYLYRNYRNASEELVHVEPSGLRTSAMPAPSDTMKGAGFAVRAEQAIADRGYSIVVRPVPGTMDFDLGAAPWGVALFGLALTALLTRYLAVSRAKQRQIEIAVVERTAELSRANESNERLEVEILERKRVESELRTAKDQAEVGSRAKSEFLAMVSHELRTPLNAVIGFSEMLASEMFGPIGDRRYQGYATDIHGSGLHLLSLINDILDLSKVEANSFELVEQELDVPAQIDDALHTVEAKAADGKISLNSKLPTILPALYADERAFKQVVLNILSNAVKFTPPGERVEISAGVNHRGEFVITIVDTGIGISEADQENVLKPFTQADSSLARQYEGTGLGLPLTRSLMELHGGRLELESRLRKGTTVRAVFPRDRIVRNRAAAE